MSSIEPITDVEIATLRQLEDEVEEAMQRVFGEFRKVRAGALGTIRQRRLYRATHATFQDYCVERWGFSRGAADKMIAGGDALEVLAELPAPPLNEAQARVLSKVDPAKREAVMSRAVADAPRKPDGKPKITASRIEQAAAAVDDWGADDAPAQGMPEHDADEVVAKIALAKRAVNDLAKTPAGRVLSRWMKEINAKLDAVRSSVKSAMPHAECCYCNGRDSSCEVCEGSGWLDKAVYESAPQELKR